MNFTAILAAIFIGLGILVSLMGLGCCLCLIWKVMDLFADWIGLFK